MSDKFLFQIDAHNKSTINKSSPVKTFQKNPLRWVLQIYYRISQQSSKYLGLLVVRSGVKERWTKTQTQGWQFNNYGSDPDRFVCSKGLKGPLGCNLHILFCPHLLHPLRIKTSQSKVFELPSFRDQRGGRLAPVRVFLTTKRPIVK